MTHWSDWDFFCHVVEHGGFTAAARALGQPKSSVSAAVQRLESELGSRLLERSTRRLRLTEAGDAIYHRAKPLFAGLRDARDEAMASRHDVNGTLRIAAPYEFGANHVAPLACRLMTKFAGLRVQVDVEHAFVNPLAEPYDIVFTMLEGPLAPSGIVMRRVFTLERGLFAAPALLQSCGEPQKPQDLLKLPLLVSQADTHWALADCNGAIEHIPIQSPRLISSNAGIRLQAALAGHGVLRVTASYCRGAVQAGALARLLPDYVCDPLNVYALLPARRLMPEKVRCFLDLLEDHARTFA